MQSDIEIAQSARLKPIHAISEALGIPEESLDPRGRHIGKVAQPWLDTLADRPDGKLILVTAISPDAGRRRQDHHHRRPGRRAQPHRQDAP